MTQQDPKSSRAMPDNFIAYDAKNPADLFSHAAAEYIESASSFLSFPELEKLREIECFILNKNTESIGGWEVPGLRGDTNIRGRVICNLYLRRFSSDRYEVMMDRFLTSLATTNSEDDSLRCIMPSWRVTLSNGDQFYPIAFHGDIEEAGRRIREGAEAFHTLVGYFSGGKFILSNGEVIDFIELNIASIDESIIPISW